MGRKLIQLQGLTVMTLIFLVLAIWWDDIKQTAWLFVILFGLTLFFSNFGPNMSTFVMPTEMFPTAIRSTCHGRVLCRDGQGGGVDRVVRFSLWVKNPSFGYAGAFYTFAGISLATIVLTWFCMFDNNEGADVMDDEFKNKLLDEDNKTLESLFRVSRAFFA